MKKQSKPKSGRKFVPVLFESDPKNNKVVLKRKIRYKDLEVEEGYTSDGLSKIFNKFDMQCIRAAVCHDKVCTGAGSTETGNRIPRKTGDRYFKEILELDGVGYFRRMRYYWAVSAYRIVTMKK